MFEPSSVFVMLLRTRAPSAVDGFVIAFSRSSDRPAQPLDLVRGQPVSGRPL